MKPVALRDSQGRKHPVMADVGCRNTVVGAEAQVASKHIDRMLQSGFRHYRLEFVHESPSGIRQVSHAFRDYFAGKINSSVLDLRLSKIPGEGTSEGSFFVPEGNMKLPTID